MTPAVEGFVVDASVAVKWYLIDEADADIALALLARFLHGEIELIAPRHIRAEIPSAISVATRVQSRGSGTQQPRLSLADATAALAEFLAIPLPVIDDDQLVLSAFDVVQKYGCAFYDGLYLALAERLGFPLILADRRFYGLIRHLPYVIWLGDYDAPNT